MNLATIIWFELRKLSRNRTVLFNLFLLPMILIFILGTALSSFFGSTETYVPEQVKVAIIGVKTSEALPVSMKAFIESPGIKEILVTAMDFTREEAVSELRSGEMDFAVVIPDDFDERIFAGGKVQLEMIHGKNNTRNLIGESLFDTFMDEANSKQAQALTAGSEVVMNGNSKGSERPSYVESGILNEQGKVYNATQYYAASMLIMFLLYSGLMASNSLSLEKERKTLSRLQSLPLSNVTIFLGKMIGCSLVTMLQALIIIGGSYLMYGVNWGDHIGLLILECVLITMASMTIAILITLLTKASSSATSVIQVVIVVMTFLSGGFAPLSVDFIQTLGKFTVNHWAQQGILHMMLNADVSQILTNIGILGAVALGLFAGAFLTYRKVGYHA